MSLMLTTNCLIKNSLKNHIAKTLCHNSKNLYNKSLYNVRQHFFNDNKYLTYEDNDKIVKNSEPNSDGIIEYRELPSNATQAVVESVDKAFKSFFGSLSPKQKGVHNKPVKIPGYLDKEGYYKVIFKKCHQKIEGKYIRLSLPKSIQASFNMKFLHFKIPKNVTPDMIQEVHIIPDSHNRFLLSFIYKSETQKLDKIKNRRYMGIDLGIDNLATLVTEAENPILIDGRELKSINHYFNKKIGEYQSKFDKPISSRYLSSLYIKRDAIIKDKLHKIANYVIKIAKERRVATIVIGHNKEWKQSVNIGKKNNQNFVQIPHSRLIKGIEYRCELNGIKCITTEESYTSKCDALALEPVEKRDSYLGKRISRGLFASSKGLLINADVNGAVNILRKVLDKCKQKTFVRKLLSNGVVTAPVRMRIS